MPVYHCVAAPRNMCRWWIGDYHFSWLRLSRSCCKMLAPYYAGTEGRGSPGVLAMGGSSFYCCVHPSLLCQSSSFLLSLCLLTWLRWLLGLQKYLHRSECASRTFQQLWHHSPSAQEEAGADTEGAG